MRYWDGSRWVGASTADPSKDSVADAPLADETSAPGGVVRTVAGVVAAVAASWLEGRWEKADPQRLVTCPTCFAVIEADNKAQHDEAAH
jgi:hypothetical protein